MLTIALFVRASVPPREIWDRSRLVGAVVVHRLTIFFFFSALALLVGYFLHCGILSEEFLLNLALLE